jgi:hypothetical protein
MYFPPRETREGWLLLTVETEVNGDSKSTNQRGPFIGRFLSCLGCSSQPSIQNIFLTVHFFNFISPLSPATWAGRRAGSPVSLCFCGLPSTEGGGVGCLLIHPHCIWFFPVHGQKKNSKNSLRKTSVLPGVMPISFPLAPLVERSTGGRNPRFDLC